MRAWVGFMWLREGKSALKFNHVLCFRLRQGMSGQVFGQLIAQGDR
jgi:hypothetical protein